MTAPDVWLIAVLCSVLAGSALASASETALFSLTEQERRRAGSRVEGLMRDPRALLVSVLCANLMFNLLFFAFASNVEVGEERWKTIARDLAAVVVVLVVGEVIPKTIALRSRVAIARAASVPFGLLVVLMGPLVRVFERAIEFFNRALGEAGHEESGITARDLEKAIDRSVDGGLLEDSEAEILSGILELEDVRVREIMTPRVDMLFLDKNTSERSGVIAKALARKDPWIVVVDENPDRIIGRIRLRDLLKDPHRELAPILTNARFVPEVASALDALHFMRQAHVAHAVVVDEWGGTAGLVTLENIFEEVVGDLRVEGEASERTVTQLGDGKFRVIGSLSIREWNEHFGRRVVATEFETVGGLVTALLGRIPRVGDEVKVGGLALAVHSVAGRRIREVDIRVDGAGPELSPEIAP